MEENTDKLRAAKYEFTKVTKVLAQIALLLGAWLGISFLQPPVIEQVIPARGRELSIVWGDTGKRMVEDGVISKDLVPLVCGGTAVLQCQQMLSEDFGKVRITKANAGFLLNLFWALGLSNKNELLETGEIVKPEYGGPANFASTGGWSAAHGPSMDHFGKHKYFELTPSQQALVAKVSAGVFRSCCDNPASFPDCNHGMAALGLLELMAAQGVSEAEMWKGALTVNSYWFPKNYLSAAEYLKAQGVLWRRADASEILGYQYSSATGSSIIKAKLAPLQQTKPSGCSI